MPLLTSCACSAQSHTLPDDVTAPSVIVLCHCISCQRRTGSAFSAAATFFHGSPSWLNYPDSSAVAKADPSLKETVGFISRTADSGKVIERAFCKACGGTVGMWPEATVDDNDNDDKKPVHRVLVIPAPNLRNFEWAKMMREEKSKVLHFWTSCAADAAFVPDGYVAYEKHVTESKG